MAGIEIEFSAKLEGIDSLIRDIRSLPEKTANNILRSAVQAGASTIAKEIQLNSPKNRENKRSKASIKYGPLKKSIKAKRARGEKGIIRSYVSFGNAFYWRFIEYGTVKMRPRPFVRLAIDRSEEKVVSAIINKLRTRIDKYWAK